MVLCGEGQVGKADTGAKAKKNSGLSLKFLFSQRGFPGLWGSYEGDFFWVRFLLGRQIEGLFFSSERRVYRKQHCNLKRYRYRKGTLELGKQTHI